MNTLNLNTTYDAILEAAKNRRFISYGDIAKAHGAEWAKVRYAMNRHLEELVQEAAERNWPLITSIVVNKNGLRTGNMDDGAIEGFVTAAKRYGRTVTSPDDFVREEQERTFDWAQAAPPSPDFPDEANDNSSKVGGPRFVKYFPHVLEGLRKLGGTAEAKDVYEEVKSLTNVPASELEGETKGGQSKFENKVGWARFYLAKAGLIDGKKRGVWALTPEGRETYLNEESALALFKDVQARFKVKAIDEEGVRTRPPRWLWKTAKF